MFQIDGSNVEVSNSFFNHSGACLYLYNQKKEKEKKKKRKRRQKQRRHEKKTRRENDISVLIVTNLDILPGREIVDFG